MRREARLPGKLLGKALALARMRTREVAVAVEFQPRLIETVVEEEVSFRPPGDAVRAEYRKLLERTYRYPGERRLSAARLVQARFFERLGWPEFFAARAASVRAPLRVWTSERDEGCSRTGPAPRPVIDLLLRPARFRDREALNRFLRHELVHASDLADPAFGWHDESLEPRIRERYDRLWCASVEERLRGGGLEPVTHAALLQRAQALGSPRCPVCGLPSASWTSPRGEVLARLRELAGPGASLDRVCDRCLEWAEVAGEPVGARG
ncbi:MAG: hypothetical protein L0216_09305 [Planctomycetales bacterium]|nr:hypothetical protein [Planctomycetales bacterium]